MNGGESADAVVARIKSAIWTFTAYSYLLTIKCVVGFIASKSSEQIDDALL